VRHCLQGHRAAFEQLVLRYQKPVFNVALRMLRNRDDAMDVAQTTFLKAFERLPTYDENYRFYSWIYRIAVNESLNALGARRNSAPINGQEPDEAPGPEQQLDGEQTGRAIEEGLMQISPELRTVIILRHFMHLSYEDMAGILTLPAKTVKSRLYSARQLLREHLVRARVDLT
jgi:RNA polymerase sigma-70 factor (ECF subfamily)